MLADCLATKSAHLEIKLGDISHHDGARQRPDMAENRQRAIIGGSVPRLLPVLLKTSYLSSPFGERRGHHRNRPNAWPINIGHRRADHLSAHSILRQRSTSRRRLQ